MWDYPALKINFKVDSCAFFLLPNMKASQSKHTEITQQTLQSLGMLSFTNGRKVRFVSVDLKAIHHWCIRSMTMIGGSKDHPLSLPHTKKNPVIEIVHKSLLWPKVLLRNELTAAQFYLLILSPWNEPNTQSNMRESVDCCFTRCFSKDFWTRIEFILMCIQHLQKPLKSYRKPSLEKKSCKNTKSEKKTERREKKKKKKERRKKILNSYKYIW